MKTIRRAEHFKREELAENRRRVQVGFRPVGRTPRGMKWPRYARYCTLDTLAVMTKNAEAFTK